VAHAVGLGGRRLRIVVSVEHEHLAVGQEHGGRVAAVHAHLETRRRPLLGAELIDVDVVLVVAAAPAACLHDAAVAIAPLAVQHA